MIKQTLSAQSRVKSDVKKLKRTKAETNAKWLVRAYNSFTLGDHAQWSFIVFAANGFDLAPGVNASLSAPETFWSGAKHWQDYYSKTQQNGLLPKMRFVIDHMYDIDEK